MQLTLTELFGFFGIIAAIISGAWIFANRFGELDVRVGRLEERVGRLEERVGRLEEQVGRLEIRMDRLEEKVDEILSFLKRKKKKHSRHKR